MSGKNEQGKMDVTQKNVLNAPLHQLSNSTSTSLPSPLHAGTCNSSHPIGAILTNSFLDFSARATGTDLRKAGVGPGQRFCLEASNWKSAVDKGIDDVPGVKLECTHKDALDSVGLDLLRKHAAMREVEDKTVKPGENQVGWARESGEIGGKDPRA